MNNRIVSLRFKAANNTVEEMINHAEHMLNLLENLRPNQPFRSRENIDHDEREIRTYREDIQIIRDNEAELRAIYAAIHSEVVPPEQNAALVAYEEALLSRRIERIKNKAEYSTVEELISEIREKRTHYQIKIGLEDPENPQWNRRQFDDRYKIDKYNFYLSYINEHEAELRAIFAALHPAEFSTFEELVAGIREAATRFEYDEIIERMGFEIYLHPEQRAFLERGMSYAAHIREELEEIYLNSRPEQIEVPPTHSERLAAISFPSELIPEQYLCPISMDIMQVPGKLLKTPDNFDFDSIKGLKKHPLTRESITNDDFKADGALRAEIDKWLDKVINSVEALKAIKEELFEEDFKSIVEQATRELADPVRRVLASSVAHIGPRDSRSRSASPVSGASSSSSAASNDSEFKDDSAPTTPRAGRR